MDLGLSYIKARDSFRNLTAFDISIPLGAGCLLQAVCDITGVDCPHWFPFFASVGLSFPFLLLVQYEIERFRTVQKTSKRRLNVVVTGATKGIGKALAREFLRQGDKVFIASRSHAGVEETIRELCDQTGADPNSDIFGVSCDISRLGDVEALTEAARRDLGGRVDCWINNAGYSGSFKPFMNSDVDTIESVVKTNLLGTMYGTRAALRMFCQQEGGGHVFNMDGAGYDGKATPNYAAYGSTKAAITQMNKSLHEEAKEANKRNSENRGVGVHTLSPGMVLTDLLLEGSTVDNRASVFNILCEHPETVAHNLVPRIRYTAVKGESGKSLRYLTVQRALGYVVNWHQRNGRFFDELGNKKYSESESERLSSSLAQQTSDDLEGGEHVVAHTVNRLAFIYSFSFMGLYFMLEHAEIATAQSLF